MHISRKFSHREIPRMTRERSLTPKRAKQREKQIYKVLSTEASGRVVESVGSGYLPPRQMDTSSMPRQARYVAGADSGMITL